MICCHYQEQHIYKLKCININMNRRNLEEPNKSLEEIINIVRFAPWLHIPTNQFLWIDDKNEFSPREYILNTPSGNNIDIRKLLNKKDGKIKYTEIGKLRLTNPFIDKGWKAGPVITFSQRAQQPILERYEKLKKIEDQINRTAFVKELSSKKIYDKDRIKGSAYMIMEFLYDLGYIATFSTKTKVFDPHNLTNYSVGILSLKNQCFDNPQYVNEKIREKLQKGFIMNNFITRIHPELEIKYN